MEGLIKALRARPADVAVAVSANVALAWVCEKKVGVCRFVRVCLRDVPISCDIPICY